jgi:hypothetical protein
MSIGEAKDTHVTVQFGRPGQVHVCSKGKCPVLNRVTVCREIAIAGHYCRGRIVGGNVAVQK